MIIVLENGEYVGFSVVSTISHAGNFKPADWVIRAMTLGITSKDPLPRHYHHEPCVVAIIDIGTKIIFTTKEIRSGIPPHYKVVTTYER